MDPFAESPPGTPAQKTFDGEVFLMKGQFLTGKFMTNKAQHDAASKGALDLTHWMDYIVRPMALEAHLEIVKVAEEDDEEWEDLGEWEEEGNEMLEEEGVGGVEGLARGVSALGFAEREGVEEEWEFWEDAEEEGDEDMVFVEADPEDTRNRVGGGPETTAPADDA